MIKTKIVILGVLHGLHNQVPSFSLERLKSTIEKIKPDVVCVELMQSEINENRKQSNKIEYGVILPYAKMNNLKVIGLDPEEPIFSKMADPYIENQKKFINRSPVESKVQNIYQTQLYDFLINEHWTTLDKTQSSITNTLFKLKHRFQEQLMGSEERDGWNKFNEYYANGISAEAKRNPGKIVLVTIGLEHVYWLKERLGKDPSFNLVDTESILK